MKKLYIILLLWYPLLSKAQFLENPFQYYKNPKTDFLVDTSMYNSGDFTITHYEYKNVASVSKELTEFFRTQGNKIISQKTNFLQKSAFEFIEKKCTYNSEKLNTIQKNYKYINNTELINIDKDSFIYENNRLKYQHHFNDINELYSIKEFIYDSINGLQKTQITQRMPGTNNYGLFEVISFHKPNLPKILNVYADMNGERELFIVTHYFYDDQDRLTGTLDSSFYNGVFLPADQNRIVYIGNTTKIDSIIYTQFYFKSSDISKLEYGKNGKVKTIFKLSRDNNEPFKLVNRYEFSSGITGLNTFGIETIKIGLFPNPTHDFIFIESKENIKQVEVFDLNGKRLLFKEENRIEQIDLSELKTGVYLLKAKSDFGFAQTKIVKTN
ncbi:MAG: T9SS type A sorting domain-containing protein [Bacteroidia bacterium]